MNKNKMYDCVGCGHIAHTHTLHIEFYLVALIMFMVMQIYFFCQDVVRLHTHCISIILIVLMMMNAFFSLSSQMKMRTEEEECVRDWEKVYWIPIEWLKTNIGRRSMLNQTKCKNVYIFALLHFVFRSPFIFGLCFRVVVAVVAIALTRRHLCTSISTHTHTHERQFPISLIQYTQISS